MRMRNAAASISLSAFAFIVAARTEPAVAKPRGPAYDFQVDAANFVTRIDNPYFPLIPGTTFKLMEKLGKRVSENTIVVTSETRVIMGVTCVVVHDQEMERGVLKEDTQDWYAQDKAGNVWYFGENTKEIDDHGKTSREGSWEAGVNGALPGIVMKARPAPGDPYRQEYGKGFAEDMGQIVAVGESVTVPFGTFTECVRTKEWSLLETGSEKKWYAKGIGVVRTESTEKEVAELVSVTRPQPLGSDR